MAQRGLALLAAAIFDVDGVLLASPHERAWREALHGIADPTQFTTALYQAKVAGLPRLAGAVAALEALGVPAAVQRAPAYAEAKQARLEALIAAGAVSAYPDALRIVRKIRSLGWTMAVASSSKNADAMMKTIRMPGGGSLLDEFQGDVCGLDLPRGKPDPGIFLAAAAALRLPPSACVVAEDAPAGIQAARAGGMAALGVARLGDADLLVAAGADLVVTSLDDVDTAALVHGQLRRRAA